MKTFILISCMMLCGAIYGNDSLLISKLLERVEALQVKESGVFPKGSIASYRLYALNKARYKADVNPFFTGLVSFTLQHLMEDFSDRQQFVARRIVTEAAQVYPKFKNRRLNRNTYNFWPTDTPAIFTNSGWINFFDKQQSLPDDFDDTVILLMAQKEHDSTAKQVHQLMQGFTNSSSRRINNTFPEYDTLGAYSTWFGKKMPVDFDVCVLANVLYFVQAYRLPWTSADSASLNLMVHAIKGKRHLTHANYVSPHYATAPIILYHIARLMSLRAIPELEALKLQLIDEARNLLQQEVLLMNKVILSSALLWWGVHPPEMVIQSNERLEDDIEDERFSFFIANIASMLPNPLKQWVGDMGLGKFYYYSPAYNHTLFIEYLILLKRKRGL